MSKYKYSLHPRIKGIVEWQLEHYPEDKREMQARKNDLIPSATAKYEPSCGISSNVSRSTEDITERISTNQYIRQLEQSTKAISYVMSRCPQIDRELVDLVYWRHEYTVEGAAMKKHMHPATAYRHINDILTAIAVEVGYVTV